MILRTSICLPPGHSREWHFCYRQEMVEQFELLKSFRFWRMTKAIKVKAEVTTLCSVGY